MNRTIAELRNAIDTVDQQLLLLLNQRASLADGIGDIKRQEGSQVYRPEREAQVIRKLQTANQGPLRAESIANVWREVRRKNCSSMTVAVSVFVLSEFGAAKLTELQS